MDEKLFTITDPANHDFDEMTREIVKMKGVSDKGDCISHAYSGKTLIEIKNCLSYCQKMVKKTF